MYVLSSCSYGKEYRVSLGQDICNFVGWPHTSYPSIPMERNIGCHRDRKCVIWRGVHVCHVSPEICLYKACWNSLTVGLISQPKVSEFKHGWNKPRSILNQKVKETQTFFFFCKGARLNGALGLFLPSLFCILVKVVETAGCGHWWSWWRRQDTVTFCHIPSKPPGEKLLKPLKSYNSRRSQFYYLFMKTSFSGANMAEYTWWWPCLLPPTRPVQSYKKLMPKQQFIHKVNSKGSLYGWAAAIESTGTGLLGGSGRGCYHVCTATDWRQEWKIAVLDTIFHFLASALFFKFFFIDVDGSTSCCPLRRFPGF